MEWNESILGTRGFFSVGKLRLCAAIEILARGNPGYLERCFV